MELFWKIDECAEYFDKVRLRGWCFHADPCIVSVVAVFSNSSEIVPVISFGQSSPDVAQFHGAQAANCRFDEFLTVSADGLGRDFYLRFFLSDGTSKRGDSAIANARDGDPYYASWFRFAERLRSLPKGIILEIGSRARSGVSRRELIPPHLTYMGLDIQAGQNVDIVGDVHELDCVVQGLRFAAVFSFAVFEHLAMPWKVALALNRVLEDGGLVYTATNQTWPVHEEPWDFFRFSKFSWQTIFNSATGFEVIETACGEPARIHASIMHPATRGLYLQPAYLGSASIVKKIADTTLAWPVSTNIAAAGNYPPGEMSAPPS